MTYTITLHGQEIEIVQDTDGKFIIPDVIKQWQPQGSALKPAWEPIIVAMKPNDGTFANNALQHGVAGINIDETRIGMPDGDSKCGGFGNGEIGFGGGDAKGVEWQKKTEGRFPANLIFSHLPECQEVCADGCAVAELDKQSGLKKGGTWNKTDGARPFNNEGKDTGHTTTKQDNTVGGASRFFYCAKAGKKERGEGNSHPTVKPIKLMTYLLTMVKMPTNNLVLDPFAGSGSTLVAAAKLGIPCIGIEMNEEYCDIIVARVEDALKASIRDEKPLKSEPTPTT